MNEKETPKNLEKIGDWSWKCRACGVVLDVPPHFCGNITGAQVMQFSDKHKNCKDPVICITCNKPFTEEFCPVCDYPRYQALEKCSKCGAVGKGFYYQGWQRICNTCGSPVESGGP